MSDEKDWKDMERHVSGADPWRVAVDLDDVVLNFLGGLINAVNTEYDAGLTVEDITNWNLHPFLDPVIGEDFWEWLKERDWLWSNFPAVPGAIGGLRRLRKDGYYLECVTSKPEWAEYNVWKWLGKWRPPFHRVTIVGQDDRKVDFSDALWLVDDKPQNCKEWAEEKRVALLFARPHNSRPTTVYPTPGPIFRVENWAQVNRTITKGWPVAYSERVMQT